MLALLEAYRLTGDARDLESVESGFAYYEGNYYERRLVVPDAMVFFANWQSQPGRPLFEATSRPEVKDLVRAFIFELHDRVIWSGFYDRVARRPEEQACVEVACGLEETGSPSRRRVSLVEPRFELDYDAIGRAGPRADFLA